MLTQIELSNLSPEADRAMGSVVGALIGDAAGGIFEFMGRHPQLMKLEQLWICQVVVYLT